MVVLKNLRMESVGMGGMVKRSFEQVAVENSIAPTTRSRVRDEELRVVHNGMQLVLDGLYRSQEKGFESSMSSDLS